MDERRINRHHWRDRVVLLPLVASLLVLGFALVRVGGEVLNDESADADPTSTSTSTSTVVASTTSTVPAPVVPASVKLATPHGTIPVYDRPNGTEIGSAGEWYGYDMTMPVVDETWGWVKIMLPERPNESTAWARLSDVTLGTNEYRIVLDRSDTKVIVYKAGVEIFRMPAGFGKASTPTPLGSFFVAVIENPGPAGYGPIVLDLSAHSEAIQSWQGAGDAIIALHGSFGSDAKIGTTGTFVSNGCIRLHREDQLKLAEIPLGTPVDIIE